MLTRMAEASGVAIPTDPEARLTRMQDNQTRLAYKPEHAVDLDTGAIVAAAI
jgi:transposase